MQCFKVFLLCLTSFVMTILKTISVFNRKRLDNAFASWREVCDVLLAQLLRLSSYKASGKSYVLRGFCSYILANEIRGMTQKAWKWQCRKKIKELVGFPVKLGGWAGWKEQTTVGLLQILSLSWELRKGFSLYHETLLAEVWSLVLWTKNSLFFH